MEEAAPLPWEASQLSRQASDIAFTFYDIEVSNAADKKYKHTIHLVTHEAACHLEVVTHLLVNTANDIEVIIY